VDWALRRDGPAIAKIKTTPIAHTRRDLFECVIAGSC
jgi:hypothetical protein